MNAVVLRYATESLQKSKEELKSLNYNCNLEFIIFTITGDYAVPKSTEIYLSATNGRIGSTEFFMRRNPSCNHLGFLAFASQEPVEIWHADLSTFLSVPVSEKFVVPTSGKL